MLLGIKKYTSFTQFFMRSLWVGHIDLVSKKLAENLGFFNKSVFLSHMSILVAKWSIYIKTKTDWAFYCECLKNGICHMKGTLARAAKGKTGRRKLAAGNYYYYYLKYIIFTMIRFREIGWHFWRFDFSKAWFLLPI